MTEAETQILHGGCECGAIRYCVEGPLGDIVECHCESCRRISGHYLALATVPNEQLHLEYNATLAWYHRTQSVRYGFCRQCGSTLFWVADDAATADDSNVRRVGRTSISAGTLDAPTRLATTMAVHTSDASDYYRIDCALKIHEREGPFADS